MREPPPLNDPSGREWVYLLRALGGLLLGIVLEALEHPIVPWTYAPGFLVVSLGLGIGVGVADRYFPNWTGLLRIVATMAVLMLALKNGQSPLPAAILYAACEATRFATRFQVN